MCIPWTITRWIIRFNILSISEQLSPTKLIHRTLPGHLPPSGTCYNSTKSPRLARMLAVCSFLISRTQLSDISASENVKTSAGRSVLATFSADRLPAAFKILLPRLSPLKDGLFDIYLLPKIPDALQIVSVTFSRPRYPHYSEVESNK